MTKTTLYLSLAGVIILSVTFGVGIGMVYQIQRDSSQIKATANVVGGLSSKAVSAVVTFGTVTNIDSNRNITLEYKGDAITIAIENDAKIYKYENSVKKEVQYGDIKLGDSLNITTTVSADGGFSGNMVIIFGSSSATGQ